MSAELANAAPARQGLARDLPIYWQEIKYEIIKLSREPMYPLSVIGFPVIFFLLFGLGNATATFHHYPFARYVLVSYSCFGSMGAALLAIGGNIAYERGHGWLELKRAFPMPPAAFVVAKLFSSLIFCVAVTLVLLAVGAATTNIAVTVPQAIALVIANIACGVVFACLGIFLGLKLAPASAPGMLYMVYLPLSLCGGLWLPLEWLPKWLQAMANVLPSYYCAQLAYAALDYPTRYSTPVLWLILTLFAALFAAAAIYVFRKQEAAR